MRTRTGWGSFSACRAAFARPAQWKRIIAFLGAVAFFGFFFAGPTPAAAQSGIFTLTGSLITARDDHTATLLNDGLVLIAGGMGATSALSSAELYNPSTGVFTNTGTLNTARREHTATLLPNGLVLIAGGNSTSSPYILSSTELYNPSTGTFSVTGSLNTARTGHTATLLPNGLVLIAGGIGIPGYASDVLSSAELYNPSTGTFTTTGSLNTGRMDHTATLLNNGMVLIAGGDSTTIYGLSSAELYNPSTGKFSLTGSLNTGRDSHTATLLNSGMVLIAGGYGVSSPYILSSAELYNSTTGKFSVSGSLNTARFYHTATLLDNGMVLIAGGTGSAGELSSAEFYNPSTATFTATGSMNAAREYDTATLLNSGMVLIAGGYSDNGSEELYQITGAPLVSSLSPPSGVAGTTVTIAGINFGTTQGTSTVTFNGKAATPCGTCWSATSITVQVPTGATTGTLVVTVTGVSSSGAYFTVNLAPAITSANKTTFTVGLAGSFTVTATGYPTPILSETGALPGGVTFIAATGVLAGTPAAGTGGSYAITFTASNGVGSNATQSFTLTVNLAPVFTTANNTTFTVGTAGSFTVTATGSPAPTLSESGTLPGGISFVASTGVLSGTPAAGTNGTFPITFTAANGIGSNATQSFTLLIASGITSLSPSSGILGTTVTIGGTGFGSTQGTSTVTFNGIPTGTAAAFWSAIKIEVAVPTGTTLGNVAVAVVVGGVTSNAVTFAVLPAKGSMYAARSGHTATLLQNGLVLMAGGGNSVGELSSAEIYTSSTGTFTVTGSMNAARSGHTATLLQNGLVLITGGENSAGVLSSAEIYNPLTGTFTVTGSMNTARSNHTATLLNSGMVLIAAGYNSAGELSSAEIYNPSTGTFTVTGNLNTARANHTATLLNNGMVLIAGGIGAAYNTLTSAELYNPSTGTFSVTGSLSTARSAHTATLLNSGMALIAGGLGASGVSDYLSSAELYNTSTGTFSVTGSLNTARYYHTATLLNNGTVLMAGGFGNLGDVGGSLSSMELYNSSTGKFSVTVSLNTARYGHTATLLNNGIVLIAGGYNGTYDSGLGTLSSTELYQISGAPLISTLSPLSGVAGTTVTITGINFGTTQGTSTVTFNGKTATPCGTCWSATSITVQVPAGATTGTLVVTVTGVSSSGAYFTVNLAPAITSANNTLFTVAYAGSFTVTATGPPTPTLSETGALPSGVTFTAATGVLAGTPAAGTGGSYAITFTASNGVGSNATQSFTLTVIKQPTVITSVNGATFITGTPGSFTVTATGSPTPTLSETGALPSGVTFTAATGVLAGTPAAGTGGGYAITFTASNGLGGNATQSFTLTVKQAPAITSANNTTFAVSEAGSFKVTATGSPAATLSEPETLPSGVTFTPSTGVLAGTPATGTVGSYPIVFTASNGVGSNATQSFTLMVIQAPPVITSDNGATFITGTLRSFTVTATGDPTPTLSESGALPTGVTFNAATGILNGTASGTVGTYSITFTASNGVGSNATQSFALVVSAQGSAVYYYFGDALGSARTITTSTGTICYDADFYPFGGERAYTNTCSQNYKFTGKERDTESGLDNLEARYFGSGLGRFMSPDPSGLLAQKPTYPQSWNLYAYAMNNPLIFIDPTGLDCVYANDAGNGVESIDHDSNSGECGKNGGSWAPGYVDENWAHFNNNTGLFQVGSINGTGNNATVDYTTFAAGAQTQFNGDESSCLSGCAGFSLANANWLQNQLVGNSTLGGLDGYIQFLTGREEQLHGGLLVRLAAGPLNPSADHWAGPGGMGPPGGRGDWAASVHDYNFFTNGITMGSYFNPALSVATSKALIQSNNKLIRNAGGIQSIKMGLFFGVANAVQWYSDSWK